MDAETPFDGLEESLAEHFSFDNMLDRALRSPVGYIYVKTALRAHHERITLPYAWKKYGQAMLDDLDKPKETSDG